MDTTKTPGINIKIIVDGIDYPFEVRGGEILDFDNNTVSKPCGTIWEEEEEVVVPEKPTKKKVEEGRTLADLSGEETAALMADLKFMKVSAVARKYRVKAIALYQLQYRNRKATSP